MSTITYDPMTEMNIAAEIELLIRSPSLPTYVQQFESLLQTEREKRERFYEEMSEDQKVEFINGEIMVHSPVRLRHNIVSQNLLVHLSTFVRQGNLGYVGYEKLLIALTRNDYEPDIVYFGPEKARTFTLDQMKFPAPDFIVEVLSPSTEAHDRGIKFVDYAIHGVAEYWIIDPDAEMVEQYTLKNKNYHLHVKTDTGTIRSTAIEGFAIPVRAIFDQAEKIAAVQAILN
jgi:Uma2 family endonuclease